MSRLIDIIKTQKGPHSMCYSHLGVHDGVVSYGVCRSLGAGKTPFESIDYVPYTLHYNLLLITNRIYGQNFKK